MATMKEASAGKLVRTLVAVRDAKEAALNRSYLSQASAYV